MRLLLLFAFLLDSLLLPAQIHLDSLSDSPPVRQSDRPLAPIQVSIGYGRQDLRAFNGAVTHLEARQFNQGQINDWNQLWQAQVPGFTVTRPGSNPNEVMDARIRGLRTLSYGQTRPLYVVDGVPGVDLFAVDPSDIVAVDVLRGAASTAIYGGRGAAGVVLITTRPASTGPLKIQYQGQVSYESAAKRYTVLDEAGYLAAGRNDASPGYTANTDWQDRVLQSAVDHAHHLAVSKGLGRGFVRAGLHYRNVTGILRESSFEQYNGSLLVSQRFWRDRLQLTAGATLGQRQSNYGFPDAYLSAVGHDPSSPVFSDDPVYIPYGGYVQASSFSVFNPVAIIEQNRNSGRTDFRLLHARAELSVWRNLTAGVQVSEQRNARHDLEFYSPSGEFRSGGSPGIGRGLAVSERTGQRTLESTLQYGFQAAQWQGELLGGYGWYQTQDAKTDVSANRIAEDAWVGKSWQQYADYLANLPDRNPGQYAFANGLRSDRQLIAFFGRAQLQWRSTYFGTVSWRREGSSNLPAATRWGSFPAFSLGVDVNQWLQFSAVDYLKASIGHGVTGTEITQSGLYQQTYRAGPEFYYNGQFVPSYGLVQNPNDQLGWERTTENTLGARLSMWNGRLQSSIDWFRYRSRGLLRNVYKPVPPNYASSTIENVGEIAGQGVELSLQYQLVNRQDLRWEMGWSVSRVQSTLENTGFVSDTVTNATIGCGCTGQYQLLYPGVPIGTFWGAVATGVNAQGAQTFADIDRNSFIQPDYYKQDQTNLGHAQPRWQMGLRQQLLWRRVDLNFLLQAVTGHRIAHEYRVAHEVNAAYVGNNVITEYYDPALKDNRNQFNNRFVENGSFLRLQYASLGYRLPLPKSKWLSSLHFQIGAQNLFTLTKYTGLDPELRLIDFGSAAGGNRYSRDYRGDPLAPGIDRRGTYPTARRWWLGVQAAF